MNSDVTPARLPVALWQMQIGGAVRGNQFWTTVKWYSGETIMVAGCKILANQVRQRVQANTLSTDLVFLEDSEWAKNAIDFYRFHSPQRTRHTI
jgi:hypothetical protein